MEIMPAHPHAPSNSNRTPWIFLFGILISLTAVIASLPSLAAPSPQPRSVDTPAADTGGVSLEIDTFGLPSSLTILKDERRKEDMEQKEHARSKLIFAAHNFFNGNFSRALEYIQEGMPSGFYLMHFKRLKSRIYYMTGRISEAIDVARDIAQDSQALLPDQIRLQYLQSVERYLNLSLDTQPMVYQVAAVISGDQKMPHRFISPVGLEIDRFGRILQTSFGTNEVVVFSKGLEFMIKISGVPNPFDVAVDPDGTIFVTSFGGDRIFRFDRDGAPKGTFGRKGSGPGEFFGPEGIAISPDRYVFVIDSGNHRVQKFTLDGNFLMSFGTRGSKPGQFLSPRTLLVENTPGSDTYTLLVMCQEGNILQRFDPYGNFVGVVPTPGLSEARDFGWFGRKGMLFSTARGELLVFEEGSDTMRPILDEKNEPLKVADVGGIAVDNEAGLIYASIQSASELRVFRPSALNEKTMLNISNINFDHYPYIGLTVQTTTGEGEPVTGLSKRNFSIEEEDHVAKLISVKPVTQVGPLNVIAHIDASSALDRRIILVRSFLDDLSRALPAGAQLSIRKGPRGMLESTDNPYLIRKSLDRLSEHVDGFLSRDIDSTIREFKAGGRRNLLLITTRDQDITVEQFASLFLNLTNNGISLFVLHLSDRQLPVLKTLCRRTGGVYRRLFETSIDDFAFQLATSKTASYFIVYASPFGLLQTNVLMDLTVRLFYLTDRVSDSIRYYAP